jgi:hypothetical protein
MADYKDPQQGDNNSFANWPDCAVDDCPNKCCLALDSVFCFPHTSGNKHVKHMKIDAQNVTLEEIEAIRG